MKQKIIYLTLILLPFIMQCYGQNTDSITIKSVKVQSCQNVFRIEIKNNYTDSICYIPMAIEYSFNTDSVYELSNDIDTTSRTRNFIISINEHTIGDFVKYYRLLPGKQVFMNIKVEQIPTMQVKDSIVVFFCTSKLEMRGGNGSNELLRKPPFSKCRRIDYSLK